MRAGVCPDRPQMANGPAPSPHNATTPWEGGGGGHAAEASRGLSASGKLGVMLGMANISPMTGLSSVLVGESGESVFVDDTQNVPFKEKTSVLRGHYSGLV